MNHEDFKDLIKRNIIDRDEEIERYKKKLIILKNEIKKLTGDFITDFSISKDYKLEFKVDDYDYKISYLTEAYEFLNLRFNVCYKNDEQESKMNTDFQGLMNHLIIKHLDYFNNLIQNNNEK